MGPCRSYARFHTRACTNQLRSSSSVRKQVSQHDRLSSRFLFSSAVMLDELIPQHRTLPGRACNAMPCRRTRASIISFFFLTLPVTYDVMRFVISFFLSFFLISPYTLIQGRLKVKSITMWSYHQWQHHHSRLADRQH